MSIQNQNADKRPYRKRARAAQEEEMRRRITEATVDLHGTIGPARTTVSAVAERAGVQRATVYRYFPDEDSLFQACSSHWLSEHPLPEIDEWAAIAEPSQRLRTGLEQMYFWFEGAAPMLDRTTRDVATVPAMRPPMEAFGMWFDAAAEALVRGRTERGRRRTRVKAAIGHAISFETWRSLTRGQGLTPPEAVDLMVAFVAAAAR